MFKIKITNPENHINNPLLRLEGREYENREVACEEIYNALYDVINSDEEGCEMVSLADITVDDYYVVRIRDYYAGAVEMMGVGIINDDPLTYAAARDKIADLDSCVYITKIGEAGRPSYYIVDSDTVAWLHCDDGSKYDWEEYDGPKDAKGNVDPDTEAAHKWMCNQDEEHVLDGVIDDCAATKRLGDDYDRACHDYILREGRATNEGVTAIVTEIA